LFWHPQILTRGAETAVRTKIIKMAYSKNLV